MTETRKKLVVWIVLRRPRSRFDLTVTDSAYDANGLRATDVDLTVTRPNQDRWCE